MTEPFLTRRIPLVGRRLVIDAPVGDYAFQRYTHGRGFRNYQTLCRGLLDETSTVLDVGANIGLTAIIAAQIAHRGRVVAIEGSARNFAALTRNLDRHAPEISAAVHCAVGAEAGEVEFVDNSTFGHVSSNRTMTGLPGSSVPQRTIDDIVAEQGLSRLDMIKLDIEGFEQDALTGARRTLARFDPVVFLEFNTWCQIVIYDRSPRRFLEWLLDRFPELHLWHEGRLVSVRETGALRFLQTNMIEHRCNDDLVAASAPERLRRLREQTESRAGIVGRLIGHLRG